jgi:hypothetical protein
MATKVKEKVNIFIVFRERLSDENKTGRYGRRKRADYEFESAVFRLSSPSLYSQKVSQNIEHKVIEAV